LSIIITYKEVKDYVENKGYELISKEYISVISKLTIKDIKGYYYFINLNSLKNGNIPLLAHKSNPYTIENIKLWCKLNNKEFNLISNTYESINKNLKWECLKEECREEFEMTWNSIYHCNHGCNYCAGQKVGLSNCLATKNPELAKEWHPTLNGDLTPYDVTCGTDKKVWWQCKDNPKHKWFAKINNRNYGRDCPYCAGKLPSEDYNLLVCNPNVCIEWDYNKNSKRPEDYTPGSIDKVWWKCSNNSEHEWYTTIACRNNGNSCPYCAGYYASKDYNLLVINPELCKEWNYNKNERNPEEYTPGNHDKVWWICEHGHEWFTSIHSRGYGNGCPECSKSKGEKKIDEVLINNNWIKINKLEIELLNNKNNNYFVPQMKYNNLIGIGGGLLSYDHYIPKLNLLIEYQGEQHERPVDFEGKGEEYAQKQFEKQLEHDRRKRKYAKNNNIRLLEIWYYDFDRIEEILNTYVLNIKIS